MPLYLPQGADFTLPRDGEEVALTLGAPLELFRALVHPHEKVRHYKRHLIPKRRSSGALSFREVWECGSDEVATVHKTFARRLNLFLRERCRFPGDIAHGYVAGRSTVTNARVHSGAYLMLRVDIANFFPTITRAWVQRLLGALQIPAAASQSLAELCTLNECLALGLHGSPVVANLACLGLDESLVALAKTYGARVSRYADDIAFSGDGVPQIEEVAVVLEKEGFHLAPNKCRTTKRGQAHFVTGLSISDPQPRVPKSLKRRVRQDLYYAGRFGLLEHLSRRQDADRQAIVNRIDGTIRYINAVEPELASRLWPQWRRILADSRLSPAYQTIAGNRQPVRILVDESELSTPEGDVLAIAMAVVGETEYVAQRLDWVLRRHLVDPSATGDKAALQRDGLHYVEASEDLRTSVFKVLESLPLRGYVAYTKLQSPGDYETAYTHLVRSLIRHRLMHCDGADVTVVFEQNSKLKLAPLQCVVEGEFQKLVARNERRPTSSPAVSFESKLGEPCLALADFILAAFRNYAVLDTPKEPKQGGRRPPGELAHKRFERLRDRIRLVLAVPEGHSFGRRNPFQPWPQGLPSRAGAVELGR
jgi:RNA-directed DNA polymerase